jgi:hypothetical protein
MSSQLSGTNGNGVVKNIIMHSFVSRHLGKIFENGVLNEEVVENNHKYLECSIGNSRA